VQDQSQKINAQSIAKSLSEQQPDNNRSLREGNLQKSCCPCKAPLGCSSW